MNAVANNIEITADHKFWIVVDGVRVARFKEDEFEDALMVWRRLATKVPFTHGDVSLNCSRGALHRACK